MTMRSQTAAASAGPNKAPTLPQKRKQKVDSEDSDHARDAQESNSDGEKDSIQSRPPAKKQKTKDVPTAQENKDQETFFDLGGKKRLTLRGFKGKSYVDIREFYGDESDLKPGKKGIMLSLETAAVMRDVLNNLDQLKDM